MRKKILLAEDNQPTGEAFLTMLEKEGHNVTWCKNGRDALLCYRNENTLIQNKDPKKFPFDLAIVDFAMPKLNGIDLIKGIMILRPLQKVLFCTAYGKDLVREASEFERNIEILEKPVNMRKLLDAVNGNPVKTIRELEAQSGLKQWNNFYELETPNTGSARNT